MLSKKMVAAGIPGVVLLARNGNHTVRLTSGYADVEHRTRMRMGDRFRVGSVTKQFVATAVLQLVGEGKLALDKTAKRAHARRRPARSQGRPPSPS